MKPQAIENLHTGLEPFDLPITISWDNCEQYAGHFKWLYGKASLTKGQVLELADKIHRLVLDEVPDDQFTSFGLREAYTLAGIKLFGCDGSALPKWTSSERMQCVRDLDVSTHVQNR